MIDADAIALGRVQVGLFAALAGALIAKDLVTRQDLCQALEIVEAGEPDKRVSDIFSLLRSEFSKPAAKEPEATPSVPFSVIQGGLAS